MSQKVKEEEKLNKQSVREIKPDILNEAFIYPSKQKKEFNFYYSEVNIMRPEEKFKQNSVMQHYNLTHNENSTNKTQRGRIPQAMWEEVSSAPKSSIGGQEDLSSNLPLVSIDLPFKSSSIPNLFPKKKEQHLMDETESLAENNKSPVSKVMANNVVREKMEERTSSLIASSYDKKITVKSKTQNSNLELHKPSEMENSRENKENEVHSHKNEFPLGKTRIDLPKQQNVMIRIHGGRIEAPGKDHIRSWKKMEGHCYKLLGPKPVVIHITESANGSKRKSLEGCQEMEAEEGNAGKEDNGFAYSKRQKITVEGESVSCIPSSAKDQEQAAKVCHYDRDSVRKFMATQKAKRREEKQAKIKRNEDERKRIEDHLQALQSRCKDTAVAPIPLPRERGSQSIFMLKSTLYQKDYEKTTLPHSSKYSEWDSGPSMVEAGIQCNGTDTSTVDLGRKRESVASYAGEPSMADKHPEEATSKRRKRSGRKKGSHDFHSDDAESVTDIVSRALQECEERLKGTVISASETEEPGAISDVSSNVEIKTVPSSRKERIAALNEMAQRLAKTIDKEEASLDKTLQNWHSKLTTHQKTAKSSRNVITHPNGAATNKNNDKPLSLAEIKAMSLEELMARMTATLPKANSKDNSSAKFIDETRLPTNHPLEEADQSNLKIYSRPLGKDQNSSAKLGNFEAGSVRSLSGSFVDSKIKTKTQLQMFSRLTELCPPPLLSFAAEELYSKRNQKLGFRPEYSYSSLEAHAATIIQSYFRGFKVRKRTSSMLTSRIRKKKFQRLLAVNIPPLIEPAITATLLKSDPCIEEPKIKANIVAESRDWYNLGKELERNSHIKLPPDPHKIKPSNLPSYVQPFYELTETGNIDEFIASCPTLNRGLASKSPTSQQRRTSKDKAASQPESFHVDGPTNETNFFLVQKPLQQQQQPVSHSRETQTAPEASEAFDINGNKHCNDQKNFKNINSDEEIDLKHFCSKAQNHLPRSRSSIPHSLTEDKDPSSGHHICPEPLTKLRKNGVDTDWVNEEAEQNYTPSSLYAKVNKISPNFSSFLKSPQSSIPSLPYQHKVSLSEFTQKGNDTDDSVSNESFSVNYKGRVEEKSNHRSTLPQDYQISPSNLSMKVSTELAYQDTLGNALSHLQDLQNLRMLSQAQEKSSDFFGAFTCAAARSDELGEELRKAKEESDTLKSSKEKAESQLAVRFRVDVERLERKAHSRILRFEHDMRKKAEQLFDSVTRRSYPDHGAIASATAAAVGASIYALQTFSQPDFKEEAETLFSSSSKSDASSAYSQDFVEASFEDTSHSLVSEKKRISSQSVEENETHSNAAEEHLEYDSSTDDEILTAASLVKNANEESPTVEEIHEHTPLSADFTSEPSKWRSVGESKSASETSNTMSFAESSNIEESENSTASHASLSECIKISDGVSASSKSNDIKQESPLANTSDEVETAKTSDVSVQEKLNFENTSDHGSSSRISERVELTERNSDLDDEDKEIMSIKLATEYSNTVKTDVSNNFICKERESHSGKRNTVPSTLSNSDVIHEDFPLQSVDDRKTVNVHTSISEMISSLATPVYTAETHSLTSQRSSSSSIHETLKNVNVSRTTEPITQLNTIRSVVDTSGTYSESFEPDSGTSDTSEPSLVRSKLQKTIIEIDTLTHQNVSNSETSKKCDGLDLPSSVAQSQTDTPKSNKGGALFSTLSLLESVQKEEEIRLRHQMAVFKLHEQSLVEEARMKLASLNSEGGTNVRKKQRAILLQLREQRAHIRRFIETQNLAAQQRHLIFWQHHQLLSATTNVSSLSINRILPSRVQSPITTRILDLSLSSSDGLESVSNNPVLFKSSAKSTLDTLSGEEARALNKHPEDKAGKGAEEGKEKTSEVASPPREREKLTKKEEKVKHKERHSKSSSSNVKPGKRSTKETSEDSAIVEEDKCDFEKKSTSYPKEGSLSTSEGKPGYSSGSERISSIDEREIASKSVEVSADNFLSGEHTEESSRSKSSSKKQPNEEIPVQMSQDSTESLSNHRLEFGSDEKAKSDSEICASRGQGSNLTKFSNETKKRKEKAVGEGGVPFFLRFPLSPRSCLRQHRRQSSESDDSFTLSQTETASDMSDGEGKLVALREELAVRKAEAEKLKKEKRKILRERVYSQELALKKQIAAYDNYIKQTKSDIEREARELQNTAAVKPLIKKPRVAGSKKLQMQDHQSLSDHSDILEESSLNESLAVDESSVVDSSFKGSEDLNLSTSSQQTESNTKEEEPQPSLAKSLIDELSSKTDEELTAEQRHSHIFKSDYKTTEDTKEEDVTSFARASLSPNQIDDSETSASHDSSTETILHSPKKSLSLKGSESSPNQVSSEQSIVTIEKDGKEAEEGEEYYEQTFTDASDTQTLKPRHTEIENDLNLAKKSVDIFIPAADQEPSETEKESEGHETISEDICEEIPTDISLSPSIDLDGKVVVRDVPQDTTDVPKSLKEEMDSNKLKEKADSLADSILESLVSESVSCMKGLVNEKQKEIREIVVHIEEPADWDLKSENVNRENQDHESSRSSVMEAFAERDTRVHSLGNRKGKSEEEKPLENFKGFDIATEVRLQKDHKINSPFENDVISKLDGVDAEELASRLLSVQVSSSSALDDVADISETFAVSSCEGKWLEGEFWKAGEKAKSEKELREEEELLNAEIARLEEIQRFKERYPDLVIREVPDKPPPPYTPKGELRPFNEENAFTPKVDTPRSITGFPEPQTPSNTISVPHRLSKADLRKIASDIISVIPSKPEEILETVETHFDLLYAEWQQGKDPSTVEHPSLLPQRDGGESSFDDEDASENSETTFQRLIFHLTRELVAGVHTLHTAPPKPVWFPSNFPHPAKPWQVIRRLTRENVLAYVKKKVLIFMGWDSPTTRESTMMKWARKKKEHVDQVLVHELQTEELSWTQYEEEEVYVKFQMSREILSTWIEETIAIFDPILQRKLSYQSRDLASSF